MGICVVGDSRKMASGSEERSGDEVGISTVVSWPTEGAGIVGSGVVSSNSGSWVVRSSFEVVMVVCLPQLPDWEPVGVGDGVALGVTEGVAEGAAGAELQVPEASGDCTIVSVSMFASSAMIIVMPPSVG